MFFLIFHLLCLCLLGTTIFFSFAQKMITNCPTTPIMNKNQYEVLFSSRNIVSKKLQASPETESIVASLLNHILEKTISIIKDIGIVTMNVSQTLLSEVAFSSTKNTIVDINHARPIDNNVILRWFSRNIFLKRFFL